MPFPSKDPRRQVLWSPILLVLFAVCALAPLNMLYISANPDVGAAVTALLAAGAVGLFWWFLTLTLGNVVRIGPRRVQVNSGLSTTRVALADIRKVTLHRTGTIELRLRRGRTVAVDAYLRKRVVGLSSARRAERAAETLRRAVNAAPPRSGGLLDLEHSRWPGVVYLALAAALSLAVWCLFALTY